MGIGLVLCVAPEHATACLNTLAQFNESAWLIGEIVQSDDPTPSVVLER